MSTHIFLVILSWLLLRINGEVVVRKYVYQRDMSEHCRRRVMPSVFIGRHVVEANAQILHFSRLDVPYSCYISVRIESGGYIILVIQIDTNDKKEAVSCDGESPMQIYEMGETFGGYWGLIPESVLSPVPNTPPKYYALHTTTTEQPMEGQESDYDADATSTTPSTPRTTREATEPTRATIAFEFPLVNVSGRLVPSEEVHKGWPSVDFEADLEAFDRLYDVTPKPGELYRTSVFPLVQFIIGKDQPEPKDEPDMRRSEDAGNTTSADPNSAAAGNDSETEEKRYEFDYEMLTLDPWLRNLFTTDTGGEWPPKRYPAFANRRFKINKLKGPNEQLYQAQDMDSTKAKDLKPTDGSLSWSDIEEIFGDLRTNSSEFKKQNSDLQRLAPLLQRMNNWQHNSSAYLSPNLTRDVLSFENSLDKKVQVASSSNKDGVHTISEMNTATEHYYLPSISEHVREDSPTTVEPYEYSATQTFIEVTNDLATKATTFVQSIIGLTTVTTENNVSKTEQQNGSSGIESLKIVAEKKSESPVSTSRTTVVSTPSESTSASSNGIIETVPDPDALANRASWENVVHVAPKIAGILNQHLLTSKHEDKKHNPNPARRRRRRRRKQKRSIHSIRIDDARPHNLTTDPVILTTPDRMYNFADKHDFAQLVELQDDDMQGHIALRFMRRYVGKTLFDLCDDETRKDDKLVLLFNTSRIVIGLSNFSLRRMTIVATPARQISIPGQRCAASDLECQISGARVCVSNLTACDGVPNCGAYDIYDEDRLSCGLAVAIEHNLYLAAFTFLAALLTVLYTVHYWLKRCVPKVSEAFFIYTNGTENILYLKTIMRSPLDEQSENISKQPLYSHKYEDILDLLAEPPKKRNIFLRIFSCCKRNKKNYMDVEMYDLDDHNKTHERFSFTENEISNLQKLPAYQDTCVQTGDSLEMNDELNDFLNRRKDSVNPCVGHREIRVASDSLRSSQDSELQILKFLREAKLSAESWDQSEASVRGMLGSRSEQTEVELELRNTVLDTIASESLELSDHTSTTILPNREMSCLSGLGTKGVATTSTAQKKLRFNDNLMTISHDKFEMNRENKDDTAGDTIHKETETDSPDHEPSSSGRRRGFWTSNKSKEKDKKLLTKKKQQSSFIKFS